MQGSRVGTSRAVVVGLVLVANLVGCTEQHLNVLVTNDDAELEGRMRRPNTPVTVQGTDMALTLVAESDAPVFEGAVLQATSVVLIGDTALVTYNTKGDGRMGALETYRVDRSGEGPDVTLTSQAIFPDTEVHSASYDGGYRVVATGASDDPALLHPAVVDAFDFSDGDLYGVRRRGLDSYAATGSVAVPGAVLVTTGSDGSLLALHPDSLDALSAVTLHDARWVDAQGSVAAVVQGTPGVVQTFDVQSAGTLRSAAATTIPGLDEEGHKSTVDMVGRWAFVASGYAGMMVVDLATGLLGAELGLPDTTDVAAEFVVTNAASAHCDLAFLSQGGAGVWVASLTGSGVVEGKKKASDDDDKSGKTDDDDDSSDDNEDAASDDDSKSGEDAKSSDDDDSSDDDSESDDDDASSDDDSASDDDDDSSDDNQDEDGDDDDSSGDGGGDDNGQGWTCAVDAPELSVEMLGGLTFDGPVSTNHVAFDGQYLFVAAGKGGLKVVRLDDQRSDE